MKLFHQAREPSWAPHGETVLEAHAASFAIGSHRIVDAVDFRLCAGEVVALVGPNGAGKTTLFGLLGGDLPLSEGDVQLGGSPIESWSQRETAMRRAVLPQQSTVTFPYLVEQIVWMGRAPWYGTAHMDEDEAIVADALAATETVSFALRQFQTLSGGERARVSLARVLAQATQVLLLDEPTAALDLRHQEMVLRLLRKTATAGAACLVILHDLGLAAAYGDRVVVMNRGRIEAEGRPHDVMTARLLSDVYEHEVDVLAHPVSGVPWIVPVRP